MRFPDVASMLISFLTPKLQVAGAEIHTTVPSPRPERFVRIERAGGAASNRVLYNPIVIIEAWATDSTEASDLAEVVRGALLHEYTAMPLVRGVEEVSGPYSVPDPESGTPRYRFTVQLKVRARR